MTAGAGLGTRRHADTVNYQLTPTITLINVESRIQNIYTIHHRLPPTTIAYLNGSKSANGPVRPESDTCQSIVITLSISRRQSVESERVGTWEWCEVPGYTGDTSC